MTAWLKRFAVQTGLALVSACVLHASSTAAWEMSTFSDFVKGRFTGLSLSRDGRLSLAPKLTTLFSSEQPSVWSVASGADGVLYLGTGHRGRVYKVDLAGKGSAIWTAPESEIFAVAVGPDGAVYAGSSPDGKIYRIEGSQATEYFNPGARYIWTLAFGPDGALYAGTGNAGKIFRVTAAGKGEVWYETGQQHITSMAVDGQGKILAGSEPNGLLYRIDAKDKAFVLYDAALPEIRTIAVSADGSVYAAALGGSVGQRAAAAASATPANSSSTTVTAPPTSITVTDESAQSGVEIKPKQAETARVTTTITPGTTVYTAPQAEMVGVEKSALYRINPDNTVETIWTSKEENLYDLLLAANNEIVFSTDTQGRIYRLTPDRRLTLLAQTNEGETTRLIPSGDSLLAAASSSGKLLKLGGGLAAEGSYEAPVHDAGSVAHWGQISWRGARSGAGKLAFRTRAGNSARPDRTWSAWSEAVSNPTGSGIGSPNARFVQWRAEFTSDGLQSPSLTGVTLSYLPQNNPPAVRSINVVTQVVPAPLSGKANSTASSSSTYSITVTDSADSGASTLSGTPTQTVSRGLAQQIQLTWQADDPDSDRLSYSIWYRGEDETLWKPLRVNIAENILTLEGDVLADGKYLFRVVASDRPSNPASAARDAELVSPPVMFDNTPPLVKATARREGKTIILTAEASDASSALRRAEYSLDATAWVPLDSTDGVVDGQRESFTLQLNNASANEHVIVVRIFDGSNNAGLAKVVVAAPAQ
ncbi:MAG: WD40 repeat domain-containing protein [Bryobacteraceae bacterium]|nr:WD40 repeat domain-containing protein [Bryobacteraceae bacterium]